MCSKYQTFLTSTFRDQEALSKQPCGVKSRNEQQGEAIAFGKAESEPAIEIHWWLLDAVSFMISLNGFVVTWKQIYDFLHLSHVTLYDTTFSYGAVGRTFHPDFLGPQSFERSKFGSLDNRMENPWWRFLWFVHPFRFTQILADDANFMELFFRERKKPPRIDLECVVDFTYIFIIMEILVVASVVFAWQDGQHYITVSEGFLACCQFQHIIGTARKRTKAQKAFEYLYLWFWFLCQFDTFLSFNCEIHDHDIDRWWN